MKAFGPGSPPVGQQQESSNNRPAVSDYNVKQKERNDSLHDPMRVGCATGSASTWPVASRRLSYKILMGRDKGPYKAGKCVLRHVSTEQMLT